MKNIIAGLLISISIFSYGQGHPQPNTGDPHGLVNWMTIEEAMAARDTLPKPIIIDMYTDWCGWCKRMMNTTFSNQSLAEYINQRFHPVRYNAETKDTILFKGKQYFNTGKTHQLAYELAGNRLSYPTLVFLGEDDQKLPLPGFRKVNELEPFLILFTEKLFGRLNPNVFYDEFQNNFYPDSTYKAEEKGKVNWMSFEEAVENQKSKPRKIFLNINGEWIISSKMMKGTYENKIIADYLNENYYPVYIEATTREDITAFGQTYINRNTDPGIHDFVGTLLKGNIQLPASFIFDEETKLLNRMQQYLSPQDLEPILKYFELENQKEISWKDYTENFDSEIK